MAAVGEEGDGRGRMTDVLGRAYMRGRLSAAQPERQNRTLSMSDLVASLELP